MVQGESLSLSVVRCKPSGVMFLSCSPLGVVPAVLAFFFYEIDTPVVSLKKKIMNPQM
jgi:hypothetical protein